MVREWKEIIVPSNLAALIGTVEWQHIHEDGSEHATTFTPPDKPYEGLFSSIPPGSRIECLDCGLIEEGMEY